MYNKKISISLVASFLLATNSLSNELYISSATKSEQSIKDVTSNVEVITKEDIEERNFTTVVEALNSLPGVITNTLGGIGQQTSVYLRGFDANKTLVLLDGIKYNDSTSSSGSPMLQHLIISNIERIEVVKGAQSGIWGPDSSAGVINIITKKPNKGISGSLNIEAGSNISRKVAANIAFSDEKVDLSLSASKLKTKGISVYSTNGEDIDKFEKDGYENKTLFLKSAYKLNDNSKIGLEHNIILAEIEGDELNNPDSKYDSKVEEKFSKFYLENRNDNLKLYTYINFSEFNREYPDALSGNEFDGNVVDTGFNLQYNYSKKSFLIGGVSYTKYRTIKEDKDDYNNKAVFLTNSTSLNDDSTIFTSSIRYDKSDKFFSETTGKIGLKQNIFEDLYISSNIGKGFNIPTIYQLFTPEIISTYGTFKVGNEDLETEKVTSYDVTIGYKNLKATYFYNKIKNLIEYVDGTTGFDNIDGTSKIKGIELSYLHNLTNDLLINLDYSYIDAREDDGTRLARRPYNKIGFSIDYYGIKNLHLNLNGIHTGHMQDRKYNPVTYGYDTIDTGRFTVLNTTGTYSINKNLDAYFKIDNFTDRKYQMVYNASSYGRTYYSGIKYRF